MPSRLFPGFYWVRPAPGAQWEPAHFDGENWWLTGSDVPMPEQSVAEVGVKLETPSA